MDGMDTGAQMRSRLREALVQGLPVSHGIEGNLAGALRETLHNPGNMIRAELAYRVARSFGQCRENAETLAVAIEYFHTASLLFDDLPAMDNASERRGAPCVHHMYGEGTAMLAALALINRAYALVWKSVAGLDPETQQRALRYLESHLGLTGLLNGQSQDLHFSALPSALRLPHQVAMGKTVSLIRLSLVLPALLGGASRFEVRRLECLAVYWGLGYQTMDDLKDVLFPAGESGKTGARDAGLNRPNQALFYGVGGAFERAARMMRLGAKTIERLARRREALGFLLETQKRFEGEMASLTKAAPAFGL
jgi:geranylgeranyl pyrophosphate synthase